MYIYSSEKDNIRDNIREQVIDAAKEGVKGVLGQSELGSALISGGEADVSDEALDAETAVPLPVEPF